MHEIYCPSCGRGYTPKKVRFDLSDVFKLEIEDDILAGKQTIPVLFTVEELEILMDKGERQDDGWYEIVISAESALRMIAPEMSLDVKEIGQNQRPHEQTLKGLIQNLIFRPGALEEDKMRVVQKAIDNMTSGSFESVKLQLKFRYDENESDVLQSIDYVNRDGRINTLTDRYCAFCSHTLPGAAGLYEQIIIGMIGTAWTGKTSYLAALAYHMLKKPAEVLKRNLIVNELTDDEDWIVFSEQVLNYKYGLSVNATRTDENIFPFFSLLLEDKSQTKRIISFVDIPGDIMSRANQSDFYDFINNKRPILKRCRLFMLCIDPIQLAAGKDNPDDCLKRSNLDEDSTKLIQITVDVIIDNVNRFLNAVGHDDKAIAVVLTKSDALSINIPDRHKMPFPDILFKDEEAVLDLNPLILHRQEVKKYFNKENSLLFIKLTNIKCDKAFFAVSAYGKKPDVNDKLRAEIKQQYDHFGVEVLDKDLSIQYDKPKSWAIGFPIVWLLSNEGFLPVCCEQLREKDYYVPDSKALLEGYMYDNAKPDKPKKRGNAFVNFLKSFRKYNREETNTVDQ